MEAPNCVLKLMDVVTQRIIYAPTIRCDTMTCRMDSEEQLDLTFSVIKVE